MSTKANLLVEHYEETPEGVELTYVIVNPTADPGIPANRWDPGTEPSVEWDCCYLKGDPLETDVEDPSLLERIEATLWDYFTRNHHELEEAYYEERMRRING